MLQQDFLTKTPRILLQSCFLSFLFSFLFNFSYTLGQIANCCPCFLINGLQKEKCFQGKLERTGRKQHEDQKQGVGSRNLESGEKEKEKER